MMRRQRSLLDLTGTSHNKLCSISCRWSQKLACCPKYQPGLHLFNWTTSEKLSDAMSVTIPYESMTTN